MGLGLGLRQILAVAAGALMLCGSAWLGGARAETADRAPAITAPHVLSKADVHRYRRIIHDERIGRFANRRSCRRN